ncbi:Kelch repeat-containing protein [Haliangium sp.]|uniref:Kelch repeat-containing protein n=2 Tax=Haliangium sp. TaxID=2663208 RepID=UPI003D150B8B
MRVTTLLMSTLLVTGCRPAVGPGPSDPPRLLPAQPGLPALPMAVTNNAVVAVPTAAGTHLLSFLGLGAGKTWRDPLSAGFHLAPGQTTWRPIADVPGPAGRLAGAAVAVAGVAYVFGGYTVAEDGSERSVESVHAYDPASGRYQVRAPMPIPVDDAVALVYADRYVYLVSGWHDLGNVNLVQLYDTRADTWTQATPFPGTPVFGHAGGIVADTMVIADGVRIEVGASGRRSFAISGEAYIGRVDEADPRRIEWHRLPPHPGRPRYRMAATGVAGGGGTVVFAGGADNPYNYDGVGYDGVPAEPSDRIFGYALADGRWRELARLPVASMDHRGLLEVDGHLVLVGGMRAGQAVTAEVVSLPWPP